MSSVGDVLRVPLDVVLALIKNRKEAASVLDTAVKGQQLQDLLALLATQKECDASSIQKTCTSLLSCGDPSLAAAVRPLMNVAATLTKATDSVQITIAHCLASLSSLSSELLRYAETNREVSVELNKQPGCQEIAIERELLSCIHRELALRASHVVRVRGHCSLPPFTQALDSLKAEAAVKLRMLSAGAPRRGVLPYSSAQEPESAAPAQQMQLQLQSKGPVHSGSLRDEIKVLAQGLQAVAAQVERLANKERCQDEGDQDGMEVEEPLPEQVCAVPALRIHEVTPHGTAFPEQVCAVPALRIHEVTPHGTAFPSRMQAWESKEFPISDNADGGLRHPSRRKDRSDDGEQRAQVGVLLARDSLSPTEPKERVQYNENSTGHARPHDCGKGGAVKLNLLGVGTVPSQSKVLRGDAAPSTSTEDLGSLPASLHQQPHHLQSAEVQTDHSPCERSVDEGEGGRHNVTCGSHDVRRQGSAEKENVDHVQSQGDNNNNNNNGGGSLPATQPEAEKPPSRNGYDVDEDGVPLEQPATDMADFEEKQEEADRNLLMKVHDPQAQCCGRMIGVDGDNKNENVTPIAMKAVAVTGLVFPSQRDSTSPGDNPGAPQSSSKPGSGDASGVEAAAGDGDDNLNLNRHDSPPGGPIGCLQRPDGAGLVALSPTPGGPMLGPQQQQQQELHVSGQPVKRAAGEYSAGFTGRMRFKRTRFASEARGALPTSQEISPPERTNARNINNNNSDNDNGAHDESSMEARAEHPEFDPGGSDNHTPPCVLVSETNHHDHNSQKPPLTDPRTVGGGGGEGSTWHALRKSVPPPSTEPRVAGAAKGATPFFISSEFVGATPACRSMMETPQTGASYRGGGGKGGLTGPRGHTNDGEQGAHVAGARKAEGSDDFLLDGR